MTAACDQTTRRNITLTRGVVVLSFGLTAAANLALLGYFARQGGLGLVGQWAWLNAILMNVLILDLGLTEALTLRIGRDGLKRSEPLLRSAQRLAAGLVLLTTAASCLCLLLDLSAVAAGWLAALAAALQLAANWRISIRLGQNQQYWFNLKTILRVVFQSLMALMLLALMPKSPAIALGLALAIGGSAELLFAFWATKNFRLQQGPYAPLADLAQAARPFALTNIAHRALQPLSVLTVALLLNTTAVAIFSLALRIPTVISQSLSEALRGLLPGLAMLRDRDPTRIPALLGDSFAAQLMALGPVVMLASACAEPLLQLWLGTVPENLLDALLILLAASAVCGMLTPFHWANYALGQEKTAARVYAIGTIASLALGACVLLWLHSLLAFVAVFAAVQIAMAAAMLAIAQTNGRLVSQSLRRVDWGKIWGVLATAVLTTWAFAMLLPGASE